MSDKLTFEVLPFSTLVNIQVSGSFYARIQALYVKKCEALTKEQLESVIEKIKSSKRASTIEEEEFMILTALIAEIENSAKTQNLTTKTEVDPEDFDKE